MHNTILIGLLIFAIYTAVILLFYFIQKKKNRESYAFESIDAEDIATPESFYFTDLDATHTNLVSTLKWKTPNTDDFIATKIYYRYTDEPNKAVLLTTTEWPKNTHQKHTHTHGGRATWFWVVAVFADGHTSEKTEVGAYIPDSAP